MLPLNSLLMLEMAETPKTVILEVVPLEIAVVAAVVVVVGCRCLSLMWTLKVQQEAPV